MAEKVESHFTPEEFASYATAVILQIELTEPQWALRDHLSFDPTGNPLCISCDKEAAGIFDIVYDLMPDPIAGNPSKSSHY